MQTRFKRNHQEAGVALIVSLFVLVILSVLAASIMLTTQTETWSATNNRSMLQARYAAEAGAQKAFNWLNYTLPTLPAIDPATLDSTKYPVQLLANGQPVILSAMSSVTTNYPDASKQTQNAFVQLQDNSVPGVGVPASFEVTAQLMSMNAGTGVSWLGAGGGSMQTWKITAQGNVPGIRNAQVQVTEIIERTGTPIFKYGVETLGTGCKALDFGGSDNSDGYNSALGPYGGTNVDPNGESIASNGNVYLGSSAKINGTIYSGLNTTVGSSCSDGVTNSGGSFGGVAALGAKLTAPLPWGCSATPCYPSPLPPTTTQNVSSACASISGCKSNGTTSIYDNNSSKTANSYTLSPGEYGNLTIANADVVHLSAGTYNVNSLDFTQDGQIVVDSGPVVFNIAGQGFSSGSTVLNSGGLSGFNLCANGVTGNPGAYGVASCGPSKAPISGVASNFQIVYAGQGTIATTGAPVSATIYAPNSLVETTGAAVGMYGSVICNNFLEGSKAPFHVDVAVRSLVQPGKYYPVSFTWSKF